MTKPNKILHWTPRVLSIIMILFVSIFALDIFGESYSFWVTIWALLMHLVPTFLLILITVTAWKREAIGGAIFIVFGFAYIFMAGTNLQLLTHLLLPTPVIIMGILFVLNYYLKHH